MNPTDSEQPTGREIVITRRLSAPRELVWRMFTEPRHLAQWWGPRGYTNPVCELDLRPGGVWRNVMRSPEGVEIPTSVVYREIVPPELLVYISSSGPAPSAVTTITFEDRNGTTVLTIRSLFDTVAGREITERLGFNEGMNQSLDRLEAALPSISRSAR